MRYFWDTKIFIVFRFYVLKYTGDWLVKEFNTFNQLIPSSIYLT